MFKVPKNKQRRTLRVNDDPNDGRKKAKLIQTSFDNNEDDNVKMDQKIKKKKKSKKKKKKLPTSFGMGFGGGMSFQDNEEENDDAFSPFMGKTKMGAMIVDDEIIHDEDNDESKTTTETNLYDQSALEKLKSQQQFFNPQEIKQEESINNDNKNDNTATGETIVMTGEEAIAQLEKSLDNNNNNNTDDTIQIDRVKEKNGLHDNDSNSINEDNDEDDDQNKNQWEEQIARRAGVSISNSNNKEEEKRNQNTATSTRKEQNDDDDGTEDDELLDPHKIIHELQTSIQKTLSQLNATKRIYESNVRKQQVEYDNIQQTSESQNSVKSIGTSLEYYQTLRLQLVSWIGALRYVQSEVLSPTITAIHKYYHIQNQDPLLLNSQTSTILLQTLQERNDLVQSFIPSNSKMLKPIISQSTQEMDEFGRDITSIRRRAQQKQRQEHRSTIQQSRQRRAVKQRREKDHECFWDTVHSDYEDSDMECSDMDILQRQENRSLLTDAIQVAINANLDTEYTQMESLCQIFQQWYQNYSDDYETCYATLSLGDLLSVFVQIQLCQYWDLYADNVILNKNIPNDNEAIGSSSYSFSLQSMPWLEQIKSFRVDAKKETNLKSVEADKKHQERTFQLLDIVCRKAIIPWINFFFDSQDIEGDKDEKVLWSYNPCSSSHTRALSSIVSFVFEHLKSAKGNDNHNKEIILQLQQKICDYLERYLRHICIPIMNSNDTTVNLMSKYVTKNEEEISMEEDAETLDAFSYASIGVVTRMKKLLVNVTTVWYHLFIDEKVKKKVAKLILMDVVAHRILPTLSLWHDTNDKNGKANEVGTAKAHSFLQEIWVSISSTGILNENDLMLQAAPLRASATLFGIK